MIRDAASRDRRSKHALAALLWCGVRLAGLVAGCETAKNAPLPSVDATVQPDSSAASSVGAQAQTTAGASQPTSTTGGGGTVSVILVADSAQDVQADLFARVIADAKAPLVERTAAASALLALHSGRSWELANGFIASGGDASLAVVTALASRIDIPPSTCTVVLASGGAIPASLRELASGLHAAATGVPAGPGPAGAGESSDATRRELEALRVQAVADRALLGSLVDEVMAKTAPRDQVALAADWLESDSTGLRAAALAQLERITREGTRLLDDQLDAIGALATDPDAGNRAAVVRRLAESDRSQDRAVLMALLGAESDPLVVTELLRLRGLEERADALALATRWLQGRLTREAAAALALRAVASAQAAQPPRGFDPLLWAAAIDGTAQAWGDAATPSVALLMATLANGTVDPTGAAARAAPLLATGLASTDSKVRRASALALLTIGRSDVIGEGVPNDPEIRRAMLEHSASVATTAADIEGLRARFRPATTAELAELAAYRAALLVALERLDLREFLKADQLLSKEELPASDRARLAQRALEAAGQDMANHGASSGLSASEQAEACAALAVRAAEHLIAAGQFDEASEALSGDVSMADPAEVDALLIAAGLGQGGGAALPARPQGESPADAADAMARGLALLRRLNPAAAAGVGGV